MSLAVFWELPTLILYTIGALVLFSFLSVTVLFLTWLERKALARFQMRMGPMRVGFHGALQPLADAFKLVLKEDILPSWADRRIYWLAPVAVMIPVFLTWVTIPLTNELVLRNLDLGLFYITAISVLSVMGLVMAGWGSANKYAVLGGLRAAGQLISYEIPFIMAILAVVMLSQSLNILEVVNDQAQNVPNILRQPAGMFIFLMAALAELGRTPFDIHHAESEVVGGPFVEYSGAHWATFFLAEYINTFTMAVLTTLLFLGGWMWPEMPFEGTLHIIISAGWFLLKTYAVILVIFWIRATYPRLRIDQLMAFGWKVLVPMSFVNIIITGGVEFYKLHWTVLTGTSLLVMTIVFYVIYMRPGTRSERMTVSVIPAWLNSPVDIPRSSTDDQHQN